MKKTLLTGALLSIVCGASFAEMQPYVGLSFNSFTISGRDGVTTNLTTGLSVPFSGETRDSGTGSGFSAGAFLSDNKRIHISSFSGKETDSSVLTVTTTSVSIDHSFNSSGVHRGWFVGGGFSRSEIKNDTGSDLSAASANGSGLFMRGGYEYKFDNQLYLDMGINVHFADIEHKVRGTGASSNIQIITKFNVSNTYLSLNYLF